MVAQRACAAACVGRAFGGRALPAQAILKALPPLFDSKDAKARERVKEITVSEPDAALALVVFWQLLVCAASIRHTLVEQRGSTLLAAWAVMGACTKHDLPGPLQAELARWMGPDLIRATLFEKMRDAMKGDVEKLLQVRSIGRQTALAWGAACELLCMGVRNSLSSGPEHAAPLHGRVVSQDAPPGRPKPERLTRKEAAKQAAAPAAECSPAPAGAAAAGAPAKRPAVAAAEEPEDEVSNEEWWVACVMGELGHV